MQLARQSTSKPSKKDTRSARAKTVAAIHITWGKLRRDLKGDKDELRDSRLVFMSRVLNRDVKSSRDLSQAKLGKVLDAMRELERSPVLPGVSGSEFRVSSSEPGTQNSKLETQIHHLATASQVATLDKLFVHLSWGEEAICDFVMRRFSRNTYRMITPKQANSLTMILFTIAASNNIKRRYREETGRNVEHVSREMIRAEIPSLKKRLGIDQQPTGDRRPQTEEEFTDEEG
jgi:hypothetical protein